LAEILLGTSGPNGTKFEPFIGVMTETEGLTARSLIGMQWTFLPNDSRAKRDCRRYGAPGFSTESVQTLARVNVTCVTPLGEETASIS
jgi:hypothetical protein